MSIKKIKSNMEAETSKPNGIAAAMGTKVESKGRAIEIATRDGWTITGTLFEHPSPKQTVLISPGTGIRQQRYYAFSEWLSEQGYAVLVIDYRGIGLSKPKRPLRKVDASLQDWARSDMEAAFQWLQTNYKGLPTSHIGHSAGAQTLGLMPSSTKLNRIVQISGSTANVRALKPKLRAQVRFLMGGYLPLAAKVLGYVPTKWLGWGEDLPRGVARQMAKWSLNPGYVTNSFDDDVYLHYYDRITAPILSIVPTDDPLARPSSIDEILAIFSNAPHVKKAIKASDYGLKEIGHNGFFSPKSKELWPLASDWLEKKCDPVPLPISSTLRLSRDTKHTLPTRNSESAFAAA